MAAGPVSRILSAGLPGGTVIPLGRALLRGSSDLPGGCDAPSRHVPEAEASGSLPIWSCSVWGLPCPPHYCGGGALLPHLFTLTRLRRRYVFCGTFRRSGLNRLPDVIRHTALWSSDFPPSFRRATVRSGCQPIHYIRWFPHDTAVIETSILLSEAA